MSLISVIMNLSNRAVTQYSNFDFNSFCKIGDKIVAASSTGLYELTGDADVETDIGASIELMTTDFGIANLKRLRSVYIGGTFAGVTTLSLKDDEGTARTYSIPVFKSGKQTGVKVSIGRNGQGRYWTIALSNVGGGDFSIDSIEVVPVILNRRPRKM